MSMFDNNDMDSMYYELIEFLKNQSIHELFYIMSVVFEHHPDLASKGGEQE